MKYWLIFTFNDGQFVHCDADGVPFMYSEPTLAEIQEVESANIFSQTFGYNIEVRGIEEAKMQAACTMREGEHEGQIEFSPIITGCHGIRIQYPELLAAESTSLV